MRSADRPVADDPDRLGAALRAVLLVGALAAAAALLGSRARAHPWAGGGLVAAEALACGCLLAALAVEAAARVPFARPALAARRLADARCLLGAAALGALTAWLLVAGLAVGAGAGFGREVCVLLGECALVLGHFRLSLLASNAAAARW